MGVKKRDKFMRTVRTLAREQGYRVGFLVIEDGDIATAFTTYKTPDDAIRGVTVLRNLLADIFDEGDEK